MLQRLYQRLNQAEHYPLYLVLLSVFSSFLLYLPVHLKDPSLIFRYWDGPNYLYVARTLYDIPANHPFTAYDLTPAYFACHLPLYPLLIRLFSYLMGYQGAMIAITLICSGLVTVLFYELIKSTQAVKSPFWSAMISLVLPARWLIYHSVGATEPLFLMLVFGSMLCWLKGKTRWAMILCGLASTTRIVGILMVLAYLFLMIHQKRYKLIPQLSLALLPLLLVFSFYSWKFGDFWAYFSWNAKLLNSIPLFIIYSFSSNGYSGQAELYLIQYIVFGVGTLLLWRQPLFFWYCLVFWCFNLFINHEDLSRYYLPITPLALVVAYDHILTSRAFKLLAPFVVLVVYLYSWPILQVNVMAEEYWPSLLQALK